MDLSKLYLTAGWWLCCPALLVPGQTHLGTITYKDWTGANAPEQNIRFSKLDSGAAIPAGLNYKTNRMLDAAGVEVSWQPMSNGDLMVRAAVPASIVPTTIGPLLAAVSGTTKGWVYGSYTTPCSSFPINTAVRFSAYSGASIPSNVTPNRTYYITGCDTNGGYISYRISSSFNGPALMVEGGTQKGFFLQTLAFAANRADLVSAAHGYSNGNSLEFDTIDGGSLPDGLSVHTIYFVCNASRDEFQVSTTGDCSHIVTTNSAGTGIPEIVSTLSWTLQAGTGTSAKAVHPPVAMEKGNAWELSNGLTGVRLPTVAYEAAHGWSLAPLESLQLADGTWTPNAGKISLDVGRNHKGSSAGSGYSVAVTENGLLEVALQARLLVHRAANFYGGGIPAMADPATSTLRSSAFQTVVPYSLSVVTPAPGLTAGQVVYVVNQNKSTGAFQISTAPGGAPIVVGRGTVQFLLLTQEPGPGYYHVTVTLDANTKALLVLEDHNIHDYRYDLNIRPNLTADTARFRSISDRDQSVPLLTSDRTSSYHSTASTFRALGSQYEPNNQNQTGHYWLLYNSQGPDSSDAAGLFLGKGSLQYYGEYPHGPGVFDTPSTAAQGFSVWDLQPAPTQSYYTGETRKSWGFWAGAKADILPPDRVQSIDVVRNSLVGINLSRIHSYGLDFPDPPGGWPYLYESDSAAAKLTAFLQNSRGLCGFQNCLYTAIHEDGYQLQLADLLLDNTYPRLATSLTPLVAQLRSFAEVFLNGEGNMSPPYHYYQGAYPCTRNQPMANLILKSKAATPWQRRQAKHFMAFCAGFLWDSDFFSSDPSLSGGLGNQISQFLQNKSQLAVELRTLPSMQPLYRASVQNILTNLIESINPYGSGYGSWHYQGAATQQGLFGWLNLANSGLLKAADFPVLARFGEWYMSGITPPEVRFGKLRMYISDGDGNTESLTDPALLATLLNPGFPGLASRLMYVWYSQGLGPPTLSSFAAPSLLAVNFEIPPIDPKLVSQHFPGTHSMLRSGWGTPFENAADFLYGGYYSAQGHAHADTGRVAAYLLGAPVSIDWNPNLYYPQVPGRFQHSTVCLDSELAPVVWSQDNAPLNACERQFTGSSPDKTNLIQTSTFNGSSAATASWTKPSDGTTFQRSVHLLNYDPNYAILHVIDSFSGAQAASAKTLTWNLMAGNGPVQTPAGMVRPAVRQNLGNNGVLPSASPVYTLDGNGLQRFAFAGAVWPNHASGGVDFDLYTRGADRQQFAIGNWCHNQYQKNCALESQDILRLHGTGDFDSWIVARKKGSADPVVSVQACGVEVVLSGTLCFDQSYSQYDSRTGTQMLATYDDTKHSGFGMTISGGPAECVLSGSAITCTIHGWQPSTRLISLPPGFHPLQPTVFKGGQVSAYAATEPVVLRFDRTSH